MEELEGVSRGQIVNGEFNEGANEMVLGEEIKADELGVELVEVGF